MRKILIAAALAAVTMPLAPATLEARAIEGACNRSDRAGASRALCACVQQVANQHLTRADQRQAARFFSDPDRAQATRVSRSDRDRAFWQRYRAFADAAEGRCR
ncbi:hypothetical protein [Rhodobaculum claviforme]|nr:hypothetical protein [Rhodobaculum claviforme]